MMGDSSSRSPVSALIAALNSQDSNTISQALNNWASYPLNTIKTVASEFLNNEELASAIEKSLNSPNAGQKDDYVCRWLYQWYQLDTLETRLFVLRYIPQLLWVYLYNVANAEAPSGVEACLLCIYNVEVEQRGNLEIIFHPPTLSLPSYLHKSSTSTSSFSSQSDGLAPPAFTAPGVNMNVGSGPNSGSLAGPSALTEGALRQFNKQAKQVTAEKALRPIGVVTSANRGAVVRVALQRYNNYISLIPSRSWVAYCKMCKRLVNFGFDFTITPLPLVKSKAFSKKYIEEDLDNLAIDSDEEFEDDEDDFPDELSDTDEEKEKDVEKGAIASPEIEASNGKDKKVMKSPGLKRKNKQAKDLSSSSSPKIPPLNFANPSNSSPQAAHPSNPASAPSSPSSSSSSAPSSAPSSTPSTPVSKEPITTTTTTTTTTPNILNMEGEITREEGEKGKEKDENEKEKDVKIAIPPRPPTRIALPAPCLQEMVTGLTFCIFKESYKENALKALRKIHLRACFDLIPEVVLSANALLYLEYQDRHKVVEVQVPGKTTPRGTAVPPNPIPIIAPTNTI